MISRSLLLVLLVLTCFQSFTMAENSNGPATCCLTFVTYSIPLRVIEKYTETRRDCSKPGVIFTLKNGRRVCAEPGLEWVQNRIKRIEQRQIASLLQTQTKKSD